MSANIISNGTVCCERNALMRRCVKAFTSIALSLKKGTLILSRPRLADPGGAASARWFRCPTNFACSMSAAARGCRGRFTRIAPRSSREWTCRAKRLRVAAARFPSDSWLQGNACDIPFPKNTFDVVCFSCVLHHIGDFAKAVDEGLRVVCPGGYVFAFDPNLLNPAMALFRCPSSWFYSPKGVSPNERPLPPSTLRKRLLGVRVDGDPTALSG